MNVRGARAANAQSCRAVSSAGEAAGARRVGSEVSTKGKGTMGFRKMNAPPFRPLALLERHKAKPSLCSDTVTM
jgi:hypothetical protein